MITTMRSYMKGPAFRVTMFIVVFALLFLWLNPQALIQMITGSTSEWVLKVNGHKVSPESYNQILQQKESELRQMQQYKKALGLTGPQFDFDPQEMAIQQAISGELLQQVGKKLKIAIPADVVKREMIRQLPPQVVGPDGSINFSLLQQFLPYKSLAEFEGWFATQLRDVSVLQTVNAAFYIPQFMVKNQIVDRYAQKNFGVAFLPLSMYVTLAKSKKVSEQDLKAFFDRENKTTKRYWLPEKRTASVWVFSPEQYNMGVTDREVERYFNAHKNNYQEVPAQRQIRHIQLPFNEKDAVKLRAQALKVLEEVKKTPETFADFAKKYSTDKKSAALGGLETIKRGEKQPKFEEAAFALSKDGDISELIQTPEGFFIIQRVSHKPAVYKAIDKVRGDIKNQLVKDKFEKSFLQSARRLIQQLRDGEEGAFVEFAQNHHATQTTKVFVAGDQSAEAGAAFSIKKLKEYTSLLQDKKGYIVQLTGLENRREPAFESVRQKVEEDFYKKRGTELMEKALTEGKQAAAHKPLSQVASDMGIQYKTTGLITLSDKSKSDSLQKEHFPVEYFTSLQKAGLVKAVLADSEGYLMMLVEAKPVDQAVLTSKKEEVAQALWRIQENLLSQGFIASLTKNATIRLNDKLTHTSVKR